MYWRVNPSTSQTAPASEASQRSNNITATSDRNSGSFLSAATVSLSIAIDIAAGVGVMRVGAVGSGVGFQKWKATKYVCQAIRSNSQASCRMGRNLQSR